MHTIKVRAHRAARRVGAEGSNWNPYARRTSSSLSQINTHDLEAGVGTSSLSEQRTLSGPCPTINEAGVRKAPKQDQNNTEHDVDTVPSLHSPQIPPSEDHGETITSKESLGTSETAVDESQSGLKPRKRKRDLFSQSKKEEQEEVHRTSSKVPKRKRKPTVVSQIRAVLFQWINILLLAVPAGFALEYAHVHGVSVFIVNFIAIIPLAGILSSATEELALHVGETIGGLLNASFGNAVELIVAIQALVQKKVVIVKTSLIGSMLSNLLLVLGMSFWLGGLNRVEQHFNVTVAQTAASLLALCIGSLIIPTVFHDWSDADENAVDKLSYGTAIILLFIYGCYLLFQLRSHIDLYNTPSQKSEKKTAKVEDGAIKRGIAHIGAGSAGMSGVSQTDLVQDDSKEEEEEEPELTVAGALVTLLISTVLVAFCSEFMVSSIDEITKQGGVSEVFVGLILLPIVGNAAEHATAVTVAMKDKMDLAIGVAVGSTMQVALLVLPFIVVIGWILDRQCMTLYFDGFQIAVLFVAVLLVNYLIQDGKSHWLEGMLLIATYVIIAVAALFYPTHAEYGNINGQCFKDSPGVAAR